MLRLRAQGLTIGEIREQCFLGDSTVKAHLHSAFRKLGLGGLRDHGKGARACYLLGRYDARAERGVASPPSPKGKPARRQDGKTASRESGVGRSF